MMDANQKARVTRVACNSDGPWWREYAIVAPLKKSHCKLSPERTAAGRKRSWLRLLMLLILAPALPLTAIAQSNPPPSKSEPGIVINPTINECNKGWDGDAGVKWSKEQFDKFCAISKSPPSIVANPTLDECNKEWNGSMRWTKEQFETFCVRLRASK